MPRRRVPGGKLADLGVDAARVGLGAARTERYADDIIDTARVGRGACSFTPTTRVLLADSRSKPIAEIKVGDRVASPPTATTTTAATTVTATWIHPDNDLVDLTVITNGGRHQTLHTTANHPFFDATTRTWTAAGDLKVGHRLQTPGSGHATVANVTHPGGQQDMHNLTTATTHTYYVLAGMTPVLVHNTAGCDPRTWRIRYGQQAGGAGRMSAAEQRFVNDLLDRKRNFQVFRTTPGAGQGDFLVIDLSNPRAPVGWVVELKSSSGAFAGQQLANADRLKATFGLTQMERASGTPQELLEIMNRGRSEWPK